MKRKVFFLKKRERKVRLKKEYSTIQDMITNFKITVETQDAKVLFKNIKEAKNNNIYSKQLLFKIAEWKSHRRSSLCLRNNNNKVNSTFQALESTTNDTERIKLLRNLQGVGIPVASAILTIYDPKNYGIIDYRVWQILYLYELVDTKPKGVGFSQADWLKYLQIIRNLANNFKVKARDIDRTLFDYHKSLEQRIC
ncbi:MAG: hypothetical protein HZR80_05105 [Candidatus Heimdallarchaeota archaeon]